MKRNLLLTLLGAVFALAQSAAQDSAPPAAVSSDTLTCVPLPAASSDTLTCVPPAAQDSVQVRRIFSDAVRAALPSVPLDYVEAGYRLHLSGADDETRRFDGLTFPLGGWDMLELTADSASCTLSIINGKRYRMEWGGQVIMEFPVQYDQLMGGARSEIESALVGRLKAAQAVPGVRRDLKSVKPVAEEDYFTVAGEHYGITQVSGSFYLTEAGEEAYAPLFDAGHPAQSVANLFICGADSLSVPLTVIIPRNDYGVRDTLVTTVESLMSVCEADGFEAYWGTEALTETKLSGTVFLCNPYLGCDHLIRLECDPRLIGREEFSISGRMSLYIPTNNIKDLFLVADPDATPKEIRYE